MVDSIQGWKQNNTMILSLGYIAMAFLCQPGAAAGSSQVRNSDSDGFTRNGTAKLGTSKPARLSKSQHVSASLSKSALISCWLRCLTSPSSTTARMTSFCKIGMWSSLRAGSKRHRFLWDAMILWISWPECCPALARKINKRIYRQLLYHMDELRRLALRHFAAGCWIVCTSNGPIRIGGTWPTWTTWTTWDEVPHLRRTGL